MTYEEFKLRMLEEEPVLFGDIGRIAFESGAIWAYNLLTEESASKEAKKEDAK